MSMRVLQDSSQISNARRDLVARGVSALEGPWRSALRRMRIPMGVPVGDELKSWDVLATLKFLEDRVAKNEPVLDIGSYSSEIIVALRKAGYGDLTGVDLNPDVRSMPFSNSIRYVVSDFLHTPFADASFKAITSISVIEHGYNAEALLREMARLLVPGGYFIASFDYWPEKIDTDGHKIFGMEWMIFSEQDVAELISRARAHGLAPVGDLEKGATSAPVHFAGKRYTFGWLALVKETSK